jgi:hypothetical protein
MAAILSFFVRCADRNTLEGTGDTRFVIASEAKQSQWWTRWGISLFGLGTRQADSEIASLSLKRHQGASGVCTFHEKRAEVHRNTLTGTRDKSEIASSLCSSQ